MTFGRKGCKLEGSLGPKWDLQKSYLERKTRNNRPRLPIARQNLLALCLHKSTSELY